MSKPFKAHVFRKVVQSGASISSAAISHSVSANVIRQ